MNEDIKRLKRATAWLSIRMGSLVIVLLSSMVTYGGNWDIDWENGLGVDDGLAHPPAHEYSINRTSSVGLPMGPLHGHYVQNVPWARSGSNVLEVYADGSNYTDDISAGDFAWRSELGFMHADYRYSPGDEHYYTMSFYPPSQYWDNETRYSIIISQWKMFSGGPHAALRLSNLGDYKLTFEGPNWDGDPKEDIGYAVPDAWNDIKVYFKKSLGSDGIVKVWLNGQLVFEHYGVNLLRDNEGYLQFGMYTETRDYRVLYMDAVRIEESIAVPLEEWATDQDSSSSPTVSITNPVEDTNFSSGGNVVINADASDLDGTVTQVEFFEGSTSLGVDTTSPYSLTWSSPANGAYALTAVATDNDSNSTTSPAVNITIGAILETVTLNATEDASLQQNRKNSTGNWSKLEIRGSTGISGIAKFNISSLSGTVADAKLRIYSATVPGTITVSAYRATGDSWSEGTVTYNNGPTKGTKIAGSDTSVSTVGQYYELDVGAFISEKVGASASLVTLWFENDSGSSTSVEFNSRTLSNPPQLEVTTSTATTNQPPTYSDWATTYNLTNNTAYADDYDSDLLDNVSEYALGGNPTNGLIEAGVMPTFGMVTDGATNYLEYVYNRRTDAESRNLTYEVRNTDDLMSGVWTNEVQEVATSAPFYASLGDEFESVTNRISMEGQTNEFARLNIILSE